MGDIIAVQDCHSHGNGDSVVAAKGRSPCLYITVFHIEIQTVGLEIMIGIRSFLTHHIHMPLEDHRLAVLIAWRPGLFDDHVVGLILLYFQPALLGERHAVITDALCVECPMGNLAQFLKKVKDSFWFYFC